MSPCQGLVESSILSSRTKKKDPWWVFFRLRLEAYLFSEVTKKTEARIEKLLSYFLAIKRRKWPKGVLKL